jgi:glutamine synthetase
MGRFSPSTENVSYFHRDSDPRIAQFLGDVRRAAAAAGVDAAYASKEYAPFQYEFTLGPSDPLRCADDLLLLRQILIECARPHGLYACLLPQPFESGFGSGLHINMTATMAGQPLFWLTNDPPGFSTRVLAFADSLQRHLAAGCAVWNPTVNSYRRLSNIEFVKTSGFVLADRRDSLLRVTRLAGDMRAGLELRVPDCTMNPYAGIGICVGLLEESISDPSREPAQSLDFPDSLEAAVRAFESDQELTKMLGPSWSNVFRSTKLEELAWHRRRVEFGDYVLSAPDIAAGLVEELLTFGDR